MALRTTFYLTYDIKCDEYVVQGHSVDQTPGPESDIEQTIRKIHTIHGKSFKSIKEATQRISEAGFFWTIKSFRPGDQTSGI